MESDFFANEEEVLNNVRKTGYRPNVVMAFCRERKVLMGHLLEHALWEFPQGGIENKESILDAVERETREELKISALGRNLSGAVLIMEDQLTFPAQYRGRRIVVTNEGEPIPFLGKHYFVVAIRTDYSWRPQRGEYDEIRWVSREEAEALNSQTPDELKRELIVRILNGLAKYGYL